MEPSTPGSLDQTLVQHMVVATGFGMEPSIPGSLDGTLVQHMVQAVGSEQTSASFGGRTGPAVQRISPGSAIPSRPKRRPQSSSSNRGGGGGGGPARPQSARTQSQGMPSSLYGRDPGGPLPVPGGSLPARRPSGSDQPVTHALDEVQFRELRKEMRDLQMIVRSDMATLCNIIGKSVSDVHEAITKDLVAVKQELGQKIEQPSTAHSTVEEIKKIDFKRNERDIQMRTMVDELRASLEEVKKIDSIRNERDIQKQTMVAEKLDEMSASLNFGELLGEIKTIGSYQRADAQKNAELVFEMTQMNNSLLSEFAKSEASVSEMNNSLLSEFKKSQVNVHASADPTLGIVKEKVDALLSSLDLRPLQEGIGAIKESLKESNDALSSSFVSQKNQIGSLFREVAKKLDNLELEFNLEPLRMEIVGMQSMVKHGQPEFFAPVFNSLESHQMATANMFSHLAAEMKSNQSNVNDADIKMLTNKINALNSDVRTIQDCSAPVLHEIRSIIRTLPEEIRKGPQHDDVIDDDDDDDDDDVELD